MSHLIDFQTTSGLVSNNHTVENEFPHFFGEYLMKQREFLPRFTIARQQACRFVRSEFS